MYLRKCVKCDIYCIHEDCVKCGKKTTNPHPVKFSIINKYAKYRRAIKEKEQ